MKIFVSLLLLLCLAGCDSQAETVTLPTGETIEITVDQLIPAETTYTGEGVSYTRTVDHYRVMSPFGVSPGETISRQTPASIQTGPQPGVTINPAGVATTEGGGSKSVLGGGKWGIVDTAWARIKTWLWIAGIAAVALVVIPVVFPAAAPVVSAIVGIIGRVIAWIIPVIGGVVEWIKARLLKRQTAEIVDGGESFKTALAADTMISQDVKEHVLSLFKAAHNGSQSPGTRQTVDQLK